MTVLVVGAGILGASIALHLAEAGAGVTVIDGGAPGATPASFAWINASWGNPHPYFRLRMAAIAEWHRLAARLPGLPLRWCGGICWDVDDLDAFARQHTAWGYRVAELGRDQIARLEPHLADPPDRALLLADEGMVEPAEATRLMLDAARDHGAVLRRGTVTGLRQRGGRVTGVTLADGTVDADEVVLATGAGTPDLLASVGIALPLAAPPGLLIRTRPIAPILNHLLIAPDIHFRQTPDGALIAGGDFGGSDPGEDAGAAAGDLLATLRRHLTGIDLLPDGHSVGRRPTPASGFPVVGRPAGLAGLRIAVMHSGVTLAAGVGRWIADEMLDDRPHPLLAPYRAEALHLLERTDT